MDTGSFWVFSGFLINRTCKKDENAAIKELEWRRYDSDKIRSVELRVKKSGFHRTLVLIF